MKIRRSACALKLAASLVLLGCWLRPATAQLLGPEFQVNSYTTFEQVSAAVAADAAGGFVVVWHSYGQDGSLMGVFGQRHNSAGGRVGSEFQVNTYTTGNQERPALAADGSGNFVVAWNSFGQDGSSWGVFAQRFDSASAPLGSEFRVNTNTTSDQQYPAVRVDGSGNFVVAWASFGQDGSGFGVVGQRFDSVGGPVGSEFQVNSYTTDSQLRPAVSAGGSGDFVVAWQSYGEDGSYWGAFGQRFDSAGTPLGTEFQANTYTGYNQHRVAVAADVAGDFVVVWGDDSRTVGVFGQRFDSAGNPVGGEFQVNSWTTGQQFSPAAAADSSGNFVVAWSSLSQDGSSGGVFGQRFDSAGNRVGSELQVNTYTPMDQRGPAVSADGAGNFVLAWQSWQDGDSYGIYGKRMTISIFADGFESGGWLAWSSAVP